MTPTRGFSRRGLALPSPLTEKIQVSFKLGTMSTARVWLLRKGGTGGKVLHRGRRRIHGINISLLAGNMYRTADGNPLSLRDICHQRHRFTSDWLRHDGAHGDGMKHQGVLCRPHARRIRQMAPVRLHDACEEADRRNAAELNSELQDLLGRSSTGERSGAGCSDVRRNS